MPRTQGFLTVNNLSKGLITEATSLSFPKDACTETWNCVHNPTGSVSRRGGFRRELNYSTRAITKTDGVVNTYFWKDVAGDGNLIMVVVQVKNTLYFYNADTTDPYVGSPSNPLSGKPISATINLSTFSPGGAPAPATQECQFTSGNGKLFVAHPYLTPFAVSFDPNTQTFTTTAIDLKIRDLEGVQDNLGISTRPAVGLGSVTNEHLYNLYNQGWDIINLTNWDNARGDFPSNADVMWLFKNSSDVFDTSTVQNVVVGNSPAAKGHFILSAFNKQRFAASGLILPDETTGYQRPSCIAFYAGRLFYSGVNYEGTNSKIYFSQIIERAEQYGYCYQTNDPTSENFFDLLPSDGGEIDIQEAGTILKMVPVSTGMAVFASNGVWMITGSTGLGFTANDYTVIKISSVPAITATSFVDLVGVPVWWNLDGIYRLDASGGGNGFQVVPLTDQTIKSFYDTIPPSEKRNARGCYNAITKTIQWLYRDTEASDLDEYYEYSNILNHDLRTGAFYTWTIPAHDIKVHGVVVLESRGGVAELVDVTDNLGNIVTDNLGNHVQAWTIGNSIVLPRFKYVISYPSSGTQFTFGEVTDTETYLDWYDYDATDFESYFITGYGLQNAVTDFQNNYAVLYIDNDSALDVQGVWDFASSGNSGRWSNKQRITTQGLEYFDYKAFKRKIRGSGRAFQMRISSVTGEPFDLSGWGLYITGVQNP